jgi:hypothetical protein
MGYSVDPPTEHSEQFVYNFVMMYIVHANGLSTRVVKEGTLEVEILPYRYKYN